MMPVANSLVDLVRAHAAADPGKTAIVFLADGELEAQRISYGELDRRVRALAAALQAHAMAGQRVLLLLNPGIDYAVGFLACAYAGAVAVPAYPPGAGSHARRIAHIAADCDARCVLAPSAAHEHLKRSVLGPVAWVDVDAHGGDAAHWREARVARDDVALLQYTSGSTGDPRGVMVTHGNLLDHAAELQAAWRLTQDEVFVSWLPMFHDMGLIGTVLQPLLMGASVVLMPPAAFMQKPMRWLRAISRYRGTVAFAPNFAYALCAKAADDAQALDLSSWRVACNAAEPVHAGALQRFARRFAACGLREEALVPGYGLAEATLHVTSSCVAQKPHVLHVDAGTLEQGRLLPLPHAQGRHFELVSCGRAVREGSVVIVDTSTTQPCADGEVGEIWVRSAAVAAGYWHRPGETAQTFGARLADGTGPWLRTGDLGALHGGELYVVGRLKDLIIIRGQNHHPSDIEHTALGVHDALGRAAAFAVEAQGQEAVVLAAELRRSARHNVDGKAIVTALRAALAESHGLSLHALVLVRPGALPITSSGKIQRRACKERFLAGGFDIEFEWRESPPPCGHISTTVEITSGLSVDEATRRLVDVLFECTAQALQFDAKRRAELRESFPALQLTMLGLDSLAAVELSYRVKAMLSVELPVSQLLGGATAAEAASYLHTQILLRSLAGNHSHAFKGQSKETCR